VRFALICFIGLLIIGSAPVPTTAGDISFELESSTVVVQSRIACLSERDISKALRGFEVGKDPGLHEARAFLLNRAKKSPECRKEVVSALMKAMDQPCLDFKNDIASYYLWREGSIVLGDLKATEALDLLTSHLGLSSNFFSLSLHQQPAVGGVIHMGPMAIPKLDALLRDSPDPMLRQTAVFCIATIGGPSAVRSLTDALPLESDKCISQIIRVSLESFDDKGHIKNRLEWSSGFMCQE
jgi:hypothetical protein